LKATRQATRAATCQATRRSRRRPGFRDYRCDCGLCGLPTSICHTEFGAPSPSASVDAARRVLRPRRLRDGLPRWLHSASPANRAGRLCVPRPRRL